MRYTANFLAYPFLVYKNAIPKNWEPIKGNRYITHLMVFLAVTAISCYDTTLNQINLHAVKLTGKTQAQFNHDTTSYTT